MNAIAQLFGGKGRSAAIMSALDQSQGIVELNGHSGEVVRVNDFSSRLLNSSKDQLQGKSLSCFCTDSDVAKEIVRCSQLHSLRSETELYMPVQSHGGASWLSLHFVPVVDSDVIVVFAREATERKIKEDTDKQNATYANALMQCQANVMLADNDLNIVYMNHTVREMLQNNESNLKQVLPNFNVSDLIGTCVDDFHKNPAHQRGMLANLSQPYQTELKVGIMTFGVVATPWVDGTGKRLGTLVEWEDKTEQLNQERETEKIAQENMRIRQALDVCDTSVMLADDELNITYVNNAVQVMLKNRKREIQSALPTFDPDNLLGVCVDDFHKNPAHQRGMLSNLKSTYRTDLKVESLTFGLTATPLFDDKGERLGTVVEWKDRTDELAARDKEQRISAENSRVRQALDAVSANVMIADADANIIYMNDSVQDMMRIAEADIRSDIHDFDAGSLIGRNMDAFHKNPAHQRNMVEALRDTYRGKIAVGGRHFSLIASPITVDGERIGTVVEWDDKTAEVMIEREVDSMLEGAMAGDFTKQLSLEGKTGFFADLSKGLNTLVSTVEVSLNDVLRMLGAMAKGDLSERITRDYQGAFGQLKVDANSTADKLTEVIGKIRSSSGAIGTAANEIAQGNADLSQRTEEQASSLEETASSMEEMTSTVRQSAANAQEANTFSDEAKEKARSGGEVVSRAITAMEEINVASKKISDIIGVIDEIAFQTNLLALNAAVEAARAGEQGRGFAVVAGEVRNLAQRSAGAAKEIKDLIRDSVTKVEDGRELVNASGETLSDIVDSVEKVSNMMREIADAALEQTSGIDQVNTAISQMDEMTQQNAALVEEASAAGQAMADQARTMSSVVEFFSVDAGHSAVARQTMESSAPISQSSSPRRIVKEVASPVPRSIPAPRAQTPSDDDWEEF